MSFFTRPRRELTYNEEKDLLFGFISWKSTHPGKDETEMRLSKMEANEARPRRDCLKIFHPRRDRDETRSKILYETETRPKVSVPLVSRPRLSSFTDQIASYLVIYILDCKLKDNIF